MDKRQLTFRGIVEMGHITDMQRCKSPNLVQPLFHTMLYCIFQLTCSFTSTYSSSFVSMSSSSSSSLYMPSSSFTSMHSSSSLTITSSVFTFTSSSPCIYMSSSTFILPSYVQSDDVGNVSLDKPGRTCRESVQLCTTTTTLILPLSQQGMVYTFIKADSGVASLEISYIITVKIITMNNNQCLREQSYLWSQQLLSFSFNYLSFIEHVGSLQFSPQPDSHPLT